MGLLKDFKRGLWDEIPIFRLILGMCPTLAVTTATINGVGMGLATTFVLVASNLLVSALRNIIPSKVRIPAFIVIIASFVTIVDLIMEAYTPAVHHALGIFIPLIVVNCIILGRAEAFASKQPVINSIVDGVGMGLGFTVVLLILGSIREIFGSGAIFGISILGANYIPFILMLLPPGAFITLGLLLGIINKFAGEARS